jgi:GTPase
VTAPDHLADAGELPSPDRPAAAARPFRAGAIAVIGRPNVGKSTLVNQLVGQKISIVSRKAQTTRHAIRGVLTSADAQYVFVDTPGFQTKFGGAMHRAMNRTVTQSLAETDVVLFLADGALRAEDHAVLKLLPREAQVVWVLSQSDKVEPAALAKRINEGQHTHPFTAIVPVSVKRPASLEALLAAIRPLLPEQPPLFDADTLSDKSERFLAAELIREKIFRLLGDELPYSAAVAIEKWEEEGNLRRIHATILVDKPAHKAMFIGEKGARMKRISTEARLEMEKLFGTKVYLETWVKVKGGWADSEAQLRSLGLM